MKNLIIPAAGQSTRFPNMRPKWMLTHPDGTLMICAAISQLEPEKFDKIYVGVLRKHLDIHIHEETLLRAFRDAGIENTIEIVGLDQATRDQVETVVKVIQQGQITGSIVIKDCDNQFSIPGTQGDENFVAYSKLEDTPGVNAANKSFLEIDDSGAVKNIVEKRVISDIFCVGSYGFSDAEKFVATAESLGKHDDRYVSDVIHAMMLDGEPFKSAKVDGYQDWGTREDWLNFIGQFKTIFCDIDGVLIKNGSQYFKGTQWGEMEPLQANIDRLRELYDSGLAHIVLTTARGEDFRKTTELELRDLGVRYHKMVMGLPHCARYLINDFSPTNPYPSASAVNIRRDSGIIGDYL